MNGTNRPFLRSWVIHQNCIVFIFLNYCYHHHHHYYQSLSLFLIYFIYFLLIYFLTGEGGTTFLIILNWSTPGPVDFFVFLVLVFHLFYALDLTSSPVLYYCLNRLGRNSSQPIQSHNLLGLKVKKINQQINKVSY